MTTMHGYDSVRAVSWSDEGLTLLDQRFLPAKVETQLVRDVIGVARAIREMVVRGAPAIGITAAYGVVLAARDRYAVAPATWQEALEEDLELLAAARPTAVNLAWALRRMRACMEATDRDPVRYLLDEAYRIHQEDIVANRQMGRLGTSLITQPCGVLTHCNTGSLATGGYGTALGVIRCGYATGKIHRVYADETRPWLQGARLTAWELVQDRIPVSLIADSAASYVMKQGTVEWVIVGADRVAANGDIANKIGTYSLAVAARFHGVRFMVVAPTSSIDLESDDGESIPIEMRSPDELLTFGSKRVAVEGADAWNPVFDITPAELVDAIVTEKGIVLEPNRDEIAALMNSGAS